LRIRFRTAAWRFLNYAISSTIGVLCLYDKDWVWQPREYFVNWPHFPLEESTRFYYAVGFGSYAYGFISLLFFEPWQSDFLAMIIHHFSTLTVIIASFLFKQTRVGVVVLLLHDVSDPFMEIAKCFLYLKWQKLADATFLLFAAVFMFTRNYIFPVYVITAPFLYQTRGDGPDDIPLAIFWLCVGCLIVLALLHVYWAFLLIKMIIRAIRAKSVEGDVRDVESDDE
ncbi:TRAM/LAG1/CLN8 homology domain-containing protein, partial [Zopfochytrium polystomum]